MVSVLTFDTHYEWSLILFMQRSVQCGKPLVLSSGEQLVINGTGGLAAFSVSDLLLTMLGIRGHLRLVTEALEFRDKCGDTRLVCEETLRGSIHGEEILEDSGILQVSVHLGKNPIQ